MGDRSDRDDPLRVHLHNVHVNHGPNGYIRKVAYDGVRPEVMGFDVVKVRRVLERRVLPVQLLHPPNPKQFRANPTCAQTSKPTNLLMFGYPERISRMLHLKCLT